MNENHTTYVEIMRYNNPLALI